MCKCEFGCSVCTPPCQLSVGNKNPELVVMNAEIVTMGVGKWPGNLALSSAEQHKRTIFDCDPKVTQYIQYCISLVQSSLFSNLEYL